MRINKGQRNFDGADLASLQADLTKVQTAIDNRLAGNGSAQQATEELDIAGLSLKAVALNDLYDIKSDLLNAIQKKQPGSTFTQVSFNGNGLSEPFDLYRGWR